MSVNGTLERLPTFWKGLPPCPRTELLAHLQSIGCGTDVACICKNEEFQSFALYTLPQLCDKAAVEAVYTAAGPVCLEAVPSFRDDRRPEILGAVTFLTLCSALAIILRFWSRTNNKQRFGLDDLFIFIAWNLTFGINVASLIAVRYGYGLHAFAITLDDVITFCKADFAAQILFGLASTLIKISILFFYDRIFPLRRFRQISITIGGLCIVWALVFIISILKSSTPIAYFWDITIKNGRGINENAFFYGISAANVVTDVAVLVLPLPWILRLDMKRSKKCGIGGIFLLGSFACIAAIVRIPLVAEYKYWDITYTIASAGIWIAVECNIGIVSACFPVMWPLLKKTPRPPYPISINSLRSLSIDIRRKKSNSITTFSGLNPPRSDRSTECQLREGASTKLSARAGTNIPYTIPKVWEVTSSLKVHDVAAMSEKESARKSIKEGDRKISWSVGRSNKDDIV